MNGEIYDLVENDLVMCKSCYSVFSVLSVQEQSTFGWHCALCETGKLVWVLPLKGYNPLEQGGKE